jgi:hypothetical protein
VRGDDLGVAKVAAPGFGWRGNYAASEFSEIISSLVVVLRGHPPDHLVHTGLAVLTLLYRHLDPP